MDFVLCDHDLFKKEKLGDNPEARGQCMCKAIFCMSPASEIPAQGRRASRTTWSKLLGDLAASSFDSSAQVCPQSSGSAEKNVPCDNSIQGNKLALCCARFCPWCYHPLDSARQQGSRGDFYAFPRVQPMGLNLNEKEVVLAVDACQGR